MGAQERRRWLAREEWLRQQNQGLPAGIDNPNNPRNRPMFQGKNPKDWIARRRIAGYRGNVGEDPNVSLNKMDYKPARGWNTRQYRTLAKFPNNLSEMYYIGQDTGDAYVPDNQGYDYGSQPYQPSYYGGGRGGGGGGGGGAQRDLRAPYNEQLAGWLTKMAQWNT